jgi:PhzF family phenazine biosynthesis protein
MNRPSRRVHVHIVNAFVCDGIGGNPAGVVLDADDLHTQDRQAIALQVGLSETAFVSSSDVADMRLEFFTPARQIAHCGHATVATFSLLHQLGRLPSGAFKKETVDGLRDVLLEGDMAFMRQLPPVGTELPLAQGPTLLDAAQSLGLAATVLSRASDPACIMSTGNRFLLIQVPRAQDLVLVRPAYRLIANISERLDLIGMYVYALQPGEQAVATTRMFAPRFGIDEEAGTGMAAGPLACRLWQRGHVKGHSFEIEQGVFMTPVCDWTWTEPMSAAWSWEAALCGRARSKWKSSGGDPDASGWRQPPPCPKSASQPSAQCLSCRNQNDSTIFFLASPPLSWWSRPRVLPRRRGV